MSDANDHDIPVSEPKPKPRRPIGLSVIAIMVAIAALIVAASSLWRMQHVTRDAKALHQQDASTIATLQGRLSSDDQQSQTRDRRLEKLESALDDLRTTNQGLDRRIANLETAFANLSGQQQSGRDTLLLNDAEMLLRTGQQRYELFHDANGAVQAYAQAIAVLAQVQNPAYAPVRVSATTERDALASAAPPSRQTALDTLSTLRAQAAALPVLKPQAAAAPASSAGFWSRVGHAFGSIVKVSHDNDKAVPPPDPRFARQSLALNLAQAQEALLAFDDGTYHGALQRADATLSTQFDDQDADVKSERARIANLLSQHGTGPAPKLGGALAQLQSLRASQAQVAPASAPASAASSGGRKP